MISPHLITFAAYKCIFFKVQIIFNIQLLLQHTNNVSTFKWFFKIQLLLQHATWKKRLEVDVAAKEAELQALKDARNVDRRLLG
jgi:hypothetical protein